MSTRSRPLAVTVGLSGWLLAAPASAQAPALPPPPANAPSTTATDTTPIAVPDELLRTEPGGITATQAGDRAAQTSWSAKAAQATLASAAARVDGAWAAFLPRLTATGKYTRLSSFTPPSFGSGSIVGTDAGGAALDPATFYSPTLNPGGSTHLFPFALAFPLVLNNYLLQANITVPISDYLFRIDQTYTAATHSREAARWDVVTARASSQASGRVAYYTWMNARGAVIVAVQALNDQKTHLRDARNQFAAGNASKADVLRAETAVASAELTLERAKNLSDLTKKQLRTAMHLGEDAPMLPGEDLESPVPPVEGNLKQMTLEAFSSRPEIKSADANAASAHDQAEAAKAGRYPVLSAFADGIYANPNPRYVPATNQWNPTWDVGAQITWSPNDIVTANSSANDIDARVANIEANKQITRDNVEVEVTQMLQGVNEADFSIESSKRELASAEEAYRVQRELFNNGRGTSTTLTDAESDLTRARLDLLNAKVAARTARVRLEHALGRDVRSGD